MPSPFLARSLLALIYTSTFFSSAIAQDLRATDNPTANGPQFHLDLKTEMSEKSYKVEPLTDYSSVTKITLSGILVATNPDNVNSLLGSNIAYISCDDSSYPGEIHAGQTFNSAIHHSPPPVGIILYSVKNASCSLTPNNYLSPSIYAMQEIASSTDVLSILQSNTTMVQNTTISPHDSGSTGGGILGKSPTTAVAMIILYSITGIITALFLIIIVIGAIRAHRHPERYGPRNIVGRPRQSRAKGIARAMLETIPIVKFGDHDHPKPTVQQQRDIEMAPPSTVQETSTQEETQQATAGPVEQRRTNEDSHEAVPTEGISESQERSQLTDDPIANADNGLACSVCTDDFTKGQDVRVLPCNHKFHPECIDPWLLNVSGTCPLCRIDLRPTVSNGDDPANPNGEPIPRRHSEALTSFAATPRSRRSSRSRPLHYLHHYLNRGRMEEATPQERLEALRRLRLINRSDVDHAAGAEGGESSATRERSTNRNRLSARLSRAFGGDRSRPNSWAPPGTPTPAVQETRDEEAEATRPEVPEPTRHEEPQAARNEERQATTREEPQATTSEGTTR
ncbi:MAG: hypothetical protein Q9170_007565 [Blastenia crenularia]